VDFCTVIQKMKFTTVFLENKQGKTCVKKH
jgi:hypothetical protein